MAIYRVEEQNHPGVDKTGRYELVAEVYCGGYAWGIACVWRDKATGRLYGATDEGCSCYGPWDDDFPLADCKQITHPREAGELLEHLSGEDGGVSTPDRQDFVRKVSIALAQ